jgi:serine protease AprX
LIEVVSGEEALTDRQAMNKGAMLRYESENFTIPPGIMKKLEKHESNLYIIEMNGPIKNEYKADLEAASVVLGNYLPEYSFIAQVDSENLEKVSAFSFVHNVRPFLPIYKVDPRLFEKGMSELVKAQVVLFKEEGFKGPRYRSVQDKLQDILELATSSDVVYLGAPEKFEPTQMVKSQG